MRILFLQKRYLFPPNTGGKIRTLNVVRYLAKWHEVIYLCNEQEGESEARMQMEELGVRVESIPWVETARYTGRFYMELLANLCSQYPYNVVKDYDRELRERAKEIISESNPDLVICDFVQMARNVIGLEVAASLLFEHNVEAQIFKRHAHTDKGWLRRAYMWLQWKKMARFERTAGHWFDRVIAVSEQDKQIYRDDYGWNHVDVIDTSVDVDFFKPQSVHPVQDRMVFVGSMDWLPNIDGMKFFCEQVLPLIRRQRPGAHIQIVGRNPTPEIQQLGEANGVEVTGSVEDTRPYLTECSLVVVPLRIGGGTRLKIPEAMAMNKPVLSTTIGAEGLPIQDRKNIVLADEATSFADSAVELLSSAELNNTIASSGYQLVQERFSAEAVARQFERICTKTIEMKQAGQ